jgi:DNA invertase Pin-like site-specific DNA recombinase
MKYIPYYRVSTDKQGRSGLGLEAQQEVVRRYLEARGGALHPAFVEVESGRKNARPELEKALSACRVHRAALIIAKLDRLSRDQHFLMSLVQKDVDVVFCDFPELPPGAVGRFMLQQMAAVAELEAGLISERTKAALKAKVARDGQWDRKSKHHLVPGAGRAIATAVAQAKATSRARDLAGHITEIRNSGIEGASRIAVELNRREISTVRGGNWQAVQVERVLKRLA